MVLIFGNLYDINVTWHVEIFSEVQTDFVPNILNNIYTYTNN